MNTRRGFIGSLLAMLGIGAAAKAVAKPAEPPFKGVGVFRYPVGEINLPDGSRLSTQTYAEQLIEKLHDVSVIMLPNTRDCDGNYVWDFRIEGIVDAKPVALPNEKDTDGNYIWSYRQPEAG